MVFRAYKLWMMLPVVAAWTGGSATAQPGSIVVRTTESNEMTGQLVSFTREQGLRLMPFGGPSAVTIPADRVVQIRQPDVSRRRNDADDVYVALSGGDRLFGVPVNWPADAVTLHCTFGRVTVPISRLNLWVEPQAKRTGKPAWHEEASDDVLFLANGDQLRGYVTEFGPEHVVIETGDREIPIRRKLLQAARIQPLDTAGEGLQFRMHFDDGSILTSSQIDWDDTRLQANGPDKKLTEFDAAMLQSIEVEGGRWTWLTDLNPISEQQTSLLGTDWPMKNNSNVLGHPLKTAGQVFDHGLGVHSQSVLIFDLTGEYDAFVTQYGLDDDSGRYANVDVEIRVDGQPRHRRQGVVPGALHGPVRIDVSGADRIELIVQFGQNGDIQDRFNWIEAALIR